MHLYWLFMVNYYEFTLIVYSMKYIMSNFGVWLLLKHEIMKLLLLMDDFYGNVIERWKAGVDLIQMNRKSMYLL